MDMKRIIRHLAFFPAQLKRAFPSSSLAAIERSIRACEDSHQGEIRFVVEGALGLIPLLKGVSARERAIEVFSALRVWDTEHNNGVLIYLLLAEHRIEIVADRGLTRATGATHWNDLVGAIGRCCRDGEVEQALLLAIEDVGACLQRHYPRSGKPPAPDAGLPNRPMIH